MQLLVIGGSVFLGRHIVLQALAAGHQVTTLNRGNHDLAEQVNVEKIIADRENISNVLQGRYFDAVIDTCGYHPESVRKSVIALKESTGTYAFVSTVSVYGTFHSPGLTEIDPIKYTSAGLPGDYGTLKADCEKVLTDLMPAHTLIIRPGLIVGPYDPTDRFTYWPARVARGGKILAPGRPARAVQFIDVRDLSAWLLMLLEKKARGIYNVTGPRERLTMQAFLEACIQSTGSSGELVWIDDKTLVEPDIKPWTELPLWLPEEDQSFSGLMELDCRKAFASGLTFSSLAQTIEDTLAWDRSRGDTVVRQAGLNLEHESALLRQMQLM